MRGANPCPAGWTSKVRKPKQACPEGRKLPSDLWLGPSQFRPRPSLASAAGAATGELAESEPQMSGPPACLVMRESRTR